MENDEQKKVRRVMDIAAQKAFIEYQKVLGEMLKEQSIDTLKALAGEATHIHSAILFDDAGHAIAVRAQWDFSTNKAIIERAIEMAREQGQLKKA